MQMVPAPLDSLRLRTKREDTVNVVIEVSPTVRKELIKKRKLEIRMSLYPVYDHMCFAALSDACTATQSNGANEKRKYPTYHNQRLLL